MNLWDLLYINPNDFFITKNKRGECYNYEKIRLTDEILNTCEKLVSERIKQLSSKEFDFLINQHSKHDFYEFKNSHPWWKKEDDNLLLKYNELYSTFMFQLLTEKITSKNIISANNDTCITLFSLTQQTNNTVVFEIIQRSCDLSLGFLADSQSINYWRNIIKRKYRDFDVKTVWTILKPHVYVNNFEKHFKDWNEYDKENRSKYIFNVRK